jgi:ADP-L-glycero-D-manno-heptose 6-epimerase
VIVVTGAAGFIGSCVLAELEARGYDDLVVVDFFSTDDRWKNIAKRRIEAVVHPFELLEFLNKNVEKVDAIIHMGAISATTELDIDRLIQQNVSYTNDLWDWCTTHKKRIIYASSAATYGDGDAGFEDDWSSAALAKLQPLNAYGWSKHVVDRRFVHHVESGRPAPAQWVGLKFFNVFGPNEYHKDDMRSVIEKLFRSVQNGEPIRLFKSYKKEFPDGGQQRDFVYVKDCVNVILWLLENDRVNGLYNVGTGQSRSFIDLVTSLGAALDKTLTPEFIDMPDGLKERYQYYTKADMAQLRAAGCDVEFMSLEEAVDDYVRHHLASPDPYL